jgi:hypothetical protein
MNLNLGTKLLASMSSEYKQIGPLRDEDRLLEPSIFTTEERKKQKVWFKKVCCGISNRLPICTDFYFERVRSRIAFVCIMIQVYLYLVLKSSIILGPLGFFPIPNCAQTLYSLDSYDYRYDMPDELIDIYNSNIESFLVSQPAFLIFSSIALCTWNSPIWVLVGAIVAIVNLSFSSIINGQFCAILSEVTPQLTIEEDGYPANANGYPLEMIVGYNIITFSLTVIVSFVLVLLAISALWNKLKGVKLFEQETTGFRNPVIGSGRSILPPTTSFEYIISIIRDFFERRVLAVPLRHVVASALSITTLIAVTSFIVFFVDYYEVLNKDVWDCIKKTGCPPEIKNPTDAFIYFVQTVLQRGWLNIFIIDQVFGSINDILKYAPFGIWIVTGLIILGILYSFYAISHQHEILVKRYESLQILKRNRRFKELVTNQSQKTSSSTSDNSTDMNLDSSLSTPPPDPRYHLAPDLRNSGHFSGYAYIVSHLLVHLAIFFVTCVLVGLLVLGVMIKFGGFQNILPQLTLLLRGQIYTIVTKLIPIVTDNVLLPLLAVLNIDPAVLFAPFRTVYIFFAGITSYSNGPYVFSPRIMLFLDTVLSLTVGLFLGIFDAVTRLGVSLFWGLIKALIMWEPVVPPSFASIDQSYMAYCSMLKGSHIEMCDIDELGEEYPPITKSGAYEPTSRSSVFNNSSSEVVEGLTLHEIQESEVKPLISASP